MRPARSSAAKEASIATTTESRTKTRLYVGDITPAWYKGPEAGREGPMGSSTHQTDDHDSKDETSLAECIRGLMRFGRIRATGL